MSCILDNIESWKDKPGKAFGTIIRKLKQNPKSVEKLKLLTEFLDFCYHGIEISIQQRFYHVWFNFFELEICPYCGSPRMFSKKAKFSIDRYGEKPTNPVNYYKTCMSESCSKKFNQERTAKILLEKYGTTNIMEIPGTLDKIKESNRKKYGTDFYTSTDEFKAKTKQTFLSKYGAHPTTLEETQDKKRKTNLKTYGFEHALSNPSVKEKAKTTNNIRYGGNSSMCSDEVKRKSRETNLKKHGVDWYTQSEDFKNKFKESMISRYGVEHALQYTNSFEKSLQTSYRKKIFIFESGRIEKIQGYEGFALCDLLDLGYKEGDITVSNKDIETYTGKIWYSDSENKKRKYYPDIYIKSENKIIEVKCKYTYEYAYSVNMRKKKASLNLGLSFEFWIYDSEGNKTVK
jgi:hypothetical protein